MASAMQVQPLVFRGTFIELAEETPQPSLGRAVTAPSAGSPPSDVFDDERSYVQDLSERFCKTPTASDERSYVPSLSEKFCKTPTASAPAAPAAFPAFLEPKSDALPHAAAVARKIQWAEVVDEPREAGAEGKPAMSNSAMNVALSSMLLRAKVIGQGGGAFMDHVFMDEPTREPSFAVVSDASGSGSSTPGPIGPAAPPSMCNTGSIGHPTLCSRPCLYFATNDCANGANCEFCHMSHAKRTPHLNKVHREQLRDMDPSRAKALLLPLVREKALAFEGSTRTANAVDRLAKACGVWSPDRMRRTREELSLSKVLNGMTVRLLLIILERSVLQNEPEAQASAEALLMHLRDSVTGAAPQR